MTKALPRPGKWLWLLIPSAVVLLWIAGCAPAAVEPTEPSEETPLRSPSPPSTSIPTVLPSPVATPDIENWAVDLEWPQTVYLGGSDIIRLTLRPSEEGYLLEAEFEDHTTQTTEIDIARQEGYLLYATAGLDAVGFTISPEQPVSRELPPDETVIWQWNIAPHKTGRQRLVVTLDVQWRPLSDTPTAARNFAAYSHSLEIRVRSFFGATRTQALGISFLGVLLGGGISLAAVLRRTSSQRPSKPQQPQITLRSPNSDLQIETSDSIILLPEEKELVKAQFQGYARLVLQQEFHSGYSGARTFMALPIHIDGRSDAETILKITRRPVILREYNNYLNYVRNTLPAVTARIDEPPVSSENNDSGCLRYTFVGKPGSPPVSLRQALLQQENPGYLRLLFETFGPKWWLQRHTDTFRLDLEYDRRLPPHYFIEPCGETGKLLDGSTPPNQVHLKIGDIVKIQNFPIAEPRSGGTYLSLTGNSVPGYPTLRLRWLSDTFQQGMTGRIVSTRTEFLQKMTAAFPQPFPGDVLAGLPDILAENLTSTRSIIHGDLNLENILVGPGELVWLIDFAETRTGHPLYDFSQLQAEIIAHVLSRKISSIDEYLSRYQQQDFPLLNEVTKIAHSCQFNPAQSREFDLALLLTCLGMLKYPNLDRHAKHFLYITASLLAWEL